MTRPLFCDLLAQAPMNLERNVSLEAAYAFKTDVLAEVASLTTTLRQRLNLTELGATDVVTTAASMAGALWQMAAPAPARAPSTNRAPNWRMRSSTSSPTSRASSARCPGPRLAPRRRSRRTSSNSASHPAFPKLIGSYKKR